MGYRQSKMGVVYSSNDQEHLGKNIWEKRRKDSAKKGGNDGLGSETNQRNGEVKREVNLDVI
jgi:hypothetical protein